MDTKIFSRHSFVVSWVSISDLSVYWPRKQSSAVGSKNGEFSINSSLRVAVLEDSFKSGHLILSSPPDFHFLLSLQRYNRCSFMVAELKSVVVGHRYWSFLFFPKKLLLRCHSGLFQGGELKIWNRERFESNSNWTHKTKTRTIIQQEVFFSTEQTTSGLLVGKGEATGMKLWCP